MKLGSGLNMASTTVFFTRSQMGNLQKLDCTKLQYDMHYSLAPCLTFETQTDVK